MSYATIRVQVRLEGEEEWDREEWSQGVSLDDTPVEHHIFYIKEVFRNALRKLYPDERYRLDIMERPGSELSGLGQLQRRGEELS